MKFFNPEYDHLGSPETKQKQWNKHYLKRATKMLTSLFLPLKKEENIFVLLAYKYTLFQSQAREERSVYVEAEEISAGNRVWGYALPTQIEIPNYGNQNWWQNIFKTKLWVKTKMRRTQKWV